MHAQPDYRLGSAVSNHSRGASGNGLSPGIKREGSEALGNSMNGGGCGEDERPEKRWRPVAGGDFISRGEVTEEEALMCFDSLPWSGKLRYFFTFREPSSGLRPIQLPFAETRSKSPLLLATVIFIGARSLAHVETAAIVLNEALSLCHLTFLSTKDPNTLSLKGIILLSLYTGIPDLLSHAVKLSWQLKTPTALIEYEDLSPEEQNSPKGRMLIQTGRTFLVSWLWSAYYSSVRGEPGGFDVTDEFLMHVCNVLEGSVDSQQPTDHTLKASVEECMILRRAYRQLGPGMRAVKLTYDEVCSITEAHIVELQNWSKQHLEVMELLTLWGDSAELRTAVPFHHGRLNLLTYIFSFVTDDTARDFPKIRAFSRMARDSALVILRFGVESRIWLPHSMIAQYLHHANIPTALQILYKSSRLFPADANFPAIRKLLNRLLNQCEAMINTNAGFERELERARLTKELVVEFDRFAFEQGSGSSPPPTDDMTLFGDDISASLSAMGGELSLFGVILLDALEYDT